MKRFIHVMLTLSLAAAVAFSQTRPSLDGRAVVAEEGVMPKGLFAKTVGYLPGDSVSVTNPSTGITINVLVLGSIDPSSGVAILLSPEAADKLFITPEVHTQVKITKRVGFLDESVAGAGTIVSDTPARTPPAIQEPTTPPEQVQPETEPLDDAMLADNIEAEGDEAEQPPVEEVIAADEVAEEIEEEPAYHIAAVEEIPSPATSSRGKQAYIVESVDATVPESTPPLHSQDMAKIVPPPAPPEDEEPEILEEEMVQEEPAVPTEVAPPEDILEGELAISDEPEVVIEPLEEDFDAEAPAEVSRLTPMILVPVGDRPPEEEQTPSSRHPAPESSSSITPEPLVAKEPESIAMHVPPTPSNFQQRLLRDLSDLERGKYYVQISTLADREKVDELLASHGIKYPMVVVPTKNGRAYQVMVGPLNVDEYGAILARFKTLGYEDSFLRKIR